MIDKSIERETPTSWKQTNSIKKRREVLSLTFAALLIGLTTNTVVLTFILKPLFLRPGKSDRAGNPARKEYSQEIPPAAQANFFVFWSLQETTVTTILVSRTEFNRSVIKVLLLSTLPAPAYGV